MRNSKVKKNAVCAIAAAGAISLAYSPVWAQSISSDNQEQQSSASQQRQTSDALISAEALKDTRVIDSRNREVGQLTNLFIDPESGKVARADIDFNGQMFGAGKTYSVPWEQLSVDRQGDQVVIAIEQSVVNRVEQANEREDQSRRSQVRQDDAARNDRTTSESRVDPTGVAGTTKTRSSQTMSSDNMSTDQIRKIQQQLNKEGFHAGSVDGQWNSQTESAIRNFQESKGLQASGQLDERTLDALGLDADEFGAREQSGRANSG
jgi:sporulation protein YlmC with PRC-barrel domain